MQILFISGGEIFIILLITLLLFGANKIPEIAKGLGKGIKEFNKVKSDITREINTVQNPGIASNPTKMGKKPNVDPQPSIINSIDNEEDKPENVTKNDLDLDKEPSNKHNL